MNKNSVFNVIIVVLFSVSVFMLFAVKNGEEENMSALSVENELTLIIDAGHGGEDGGAVAYGNIYEKDINLDISKRLELLFNVCGVNTDMIRREDAAVGETGLKTIRRRKVSDMKKRVEIISETNGATLISVHQNSFPQDGSCFGAQVFYSKQNSKSAEIAKEVQEALKNGIDDGNRRKVKPAGENVYIMNNINCPAILVECGFLSNNRELELLRSDNYQKKLSACIVSGFLKYKNEK